MLPRLSVARKASAVAVHLQPGRLGRAGGPRHARHGCMRSINAALVALKPRIFKTPISRSTAFPCTHIDRVRVEDEPRCPRREEVRLSTRSSSSSSEQGRRARVHLSDLLSAAKVSNRWTSARHGGSAPPDRSYTILTSTIRSSTQGQDTSTLARHYPSVSPSDRIDHSTSRCGHHRPPGCSSTQQTRRWARKGRGRVPRSRATRSPGLSA